MTAMAEVITTGNMIVITTSGRCRQCGHTATRTSEPWSNLFRCGHGCRCTMQGCCPSETASGTTPALAHPRYLNGAPA